MHFSLTVRHDVANSNVPTAMHAISGGTFDESPRPVLQTATISYLIHNALLPRFPILHDALPSLNLFPLRLFRTNLPHSVSAPQKGRRAMVSVPPTPHLSFQTPLSTWHPEHFAPGWRAPPFCIWLPRPSVPSACPARTVCHPCSA